MKKLLAAAAAFGLLLLWSCQTTDSTKDVFEVEGDSTWTSCDSVVIVLLDKGGKVLDTLFNDSLKSIDQLKHLSASKYPGGEAQIHITGTKHGGLCFEENRSFDGSNGKVTVDTLSDTAAKPVSVEATPDDTLILTMGGNAGLAQAKVKPGYADQGILWLQDGDNGIVTVEEQPAAGVSQLKVTAVKPGTGRLIASSKKDTSKKDIVYIKVVSAAGKSLVLSKDSLGLFQGGPGDSLSATVLPPEASQAVTWTSRDGNVATVDSNGRVTPVKAGSTYVVAASKSTSGKDSALVVVTLDVPKLTISSKTGAPVNTNIVFSATARQSFGVLVAYKWDLDGDGAWDDSLHGPWSGDSVDLPSVAAKYSKEGTYQAKFLVRDGEGNEAAASVSLDIGNQPPEFEAIRPDTIISIKDSIAMTATVHDVDGKVAACAWDYDGDGKFDDSVTASDSTVKVAMGHRYPSPGNFKAVLRATDDNGKSRLDTVLIKVELDPPTADAGPDLSITAGSPLAVHAKGSDKYGPIVKRELKVGSGSYVTLSHQDTTILTPAEPGVLAIVVRVTDDDGNAAEDTANITLVAPTKSNDSLAVLTPSAGTLAPAFKPVTLFYSVSVAYSDSQVTVTAIPSDPSAQMAVNGKPVASGSASDPVDVKVGTTVNAFQIVVTAQDGSQKVYSVSVTRAPSNDSRLGKLESDGFNLKPAFDPAVLEYADTVSFATTAIDVKPTVSHPAAKVTVNDSLVASGTISKPLSLLPGDNVIKVVVTAQDGVSKTTYKIHVVRKGKIVVYQALGGLTPTVTDSSEAVIGASLKISHPPVTGYHFQQWSVTQGKASIGDSLADTTTLIMDSSVVRVKSSMAINVYTISTEVVGAIGGIFSPDSIKVEHGTDATITVTPLTGFRVLSLQDDGKNVSVLASTYGAWTYKLTNVTANHHITSSFKEYFALTTSVTSGHGTISGSQNIDKGDSAIVRLDAMLSAPVDSGYHLAALTDNGSDVLSAVTSPVVGTSYYKIPNMDTLHTIQATFSVRTYPLTINGIGVCITQTNPPPCGILFCRQLCVAGQSTMTVNAIQNVPYTISTASADANNVAFTEWYHSGKLGTKLFYSYNNPEKNVVLSTGGSTLYSFYNGAVIFLQRADGGASAPNGASSSK